MTGTVAWVRSVTGESGAGKVRETGRDRSSQLSSTAQEIYLLDTIESQ